MFWMAQVDETEYLKLYQKIQTKKELLERIIKDGKSLSASGSDYAIHREVGVPQNMINVLVSTEKFEYFSKTITPEGADDTTSVDERGYERRFHRLPNELDENLDQPTSSLRVTDSGSEDNDSSNDSNISSDNPANYGNLSRFSMEETHTEFYSHTDLKTSLNEKTGSLNIANDSDSLLTNSSDENYSSTNDHKQDDPHNSTSGHREILMRSNLSETHSSPVSLDAESMTGSDSTDFEDYENLDIEDIGTNMQTDDVAFAKRIRKCCDDFGREIPRFLDDTAECLTGLACCYLQKKYEDKMERKLNFIRAATLINAALVRHQMTGDKENYEITIELLRGLHQQVLKESVSTKTDQDYVDFCSNIREKVDRLRVEENAKLVEVQRVRHRVEDEMLDAPTSQNPTILMIKQISKTNSLNYKKLMVEIIEKCFHSMGDPPCQFAIAGLGSLAREEVTLSSDFEHVIILQDGTPDDEEIREYFRWFTVIFHVIIIGLRETIIPSVDIKSLCDHYSSDVSEKWFKDFYTPCGLSFDGMMPHACKCPLGRQTPTENYEYGVELIQTSSVMASYLTKEEQLKHGYMLDDVLSTTCCVYGSSQVYECFLAKREIAQNSATAEELFLQQQHLLKSLVVNWKSTYAAALQFIDVKKSLYRPITYLLHFLATQLNLTSQSSFDIIDDLRFRGIIDEPIRHLLHHSVAIALEIRMRSYRTKHRQRNAISYRDLPKKVGRNCSAIFRVVVQFFLCAVRDYAYRRFVLKRDYNTLTFPTIDGDIWKCEVLQSSFHVCDEEGEILHRVLNSIESLLSSVREDDDRQTYQSYLYLKMYFQSLCGAIHRIIVRYQIGDSNRSSHDSPSIRKIYMWANEKMLEFGLDLETKILLLTMKASVLYLCGGDKYQEANAILDDALHTYTVISQASSYPWERHVDLEVQIKIAALAPYDALGYFRKALKRNDVNIYMEYVYRIGIAKVLWLQGNKSKAKRKLEIVKSEVVSFPQVLSRTDYRIISELVAATFQAFGNNCASTSVLEPLYESIDATIAGRFPGIDDRVAKLNELTHYKYNFGAYYNVGRYSNFTFNMIEYDEPLYVNRAVTKEAHALHIFSSVCYNDMIALIQYSLDGEVRDYANNFAMLKGMPNIWKQTKLIALMALCENMRSQDFDLATTLLERTSDKVIRIKVLQPFLYACFKDLSPHLTANCNVITKQNAIFQQLLQFPTKQELLKKESLSSFLTFNFKKSSKLSWEILHYEKSNGKDLTQTLEFFLTSVMTVMVVRKRKSPLPHLKKCREISTMQSLWLKTCCIDENQVGSVTRQAFQLTSFYSREITQCAIIYNLAVNFVFFDERACSALLWKLINWRKLNRNLYVRSVYLMLKAWERIWDGTDAFSYIKRM